MKNNAAAAMETVETRVRLGLFFKNDLPISTVSKKLK